VVAVFSCCRRRLLAFSLSYTERFKIHTAPPFSFFSKHLSLSLLADFSSETIDLWLLSQAEKLREAKVKKKLSRKSVRQGVGNEKRIGNIMQELHFYEISGFEERENSAVIFCHS
jgi:hypothetical protein